eukprot:gene16627-8059_t
MNLTAFLWRIAFILYFCQHRCFSIIEDVLLPYQKSHDDTKRNHRYVRECQHIIHGNKTFETYRSYNTSKENSVEYLKYLTHKIESRQDTFGIKKKYVHGHIALINNPAKTFSVLYPGSKATCSQWSGIRETVSNTAKHAKCTIAINAGFFNTHTAGCLGNIVSNGHMIHDSNGVQNANFGIRKNGELVVGYLSDDDVTEKNNPFVQLISGVGWLIRNGIYINDSKKAECADTEETGTIERFFNVISARSAIGHDKDGRIILITIDGKTDKQGVNLLELARILKEHGAVNAINLDGGGSATFVVNGTVINYPSDMCGKDYSCERKVSTIICIHNSVCGNCVCSGTRGQCINGVCHCNHSRPSNVSVENLHQQNGKRIISNVDGSKKDETSKNVIFKESLGGIWFISLTAVLGCSLLMNIFLVVMLRVSKKKQEKPWRQGDLRGLLDEDSDGV